MRTSGSGRSLGNPKEWQWAEPRARAIVALSSDLVLPGRRETIKYPRIPSPHLWAPPGWVHRCVPGDPPRRAQSWALCCQPSGRAQERWGLGALIRMCQDPGLASTHLPSTAQAAPESRCWPPAPSALSTAWRGDQAFVQATRFGGAKLHGSLVAG